MPSQPLVIEYIPIEELRPDVKNPRRIADEALDELTREVDQVGWAAPLVARLDGTLLSGHQRLVVARRLGMTHVPVVRLDVDEALGHVIALRLNRSSGEYDTPLLARLLAELEASPQIDVSLTGFADDELERLRASLDVREKRSRIESFDLDEALAATQRAGRSAPGDLWQLGRHTLACGDATDEVVVAAALGGRRPTMAFADVPYNVNLGRHGGHRPGTPRRRMANDALDPAAHEAFVRAWARMLLKTADGALYVMPGSKELPLVSRVLTEEGWHQSGLLVWVKDRFVPGRADYQHGHEPILYGWREGADHRWHGGRDQSDVWRFERPSRSPAHPTMKPVELVVRAVENSSGPADLVLDPFGGSGTTLIAAERTGRACAMVELDPHYCDVILARWEAFSGQTAVRLHAGVGAAAEASR